jgi:hypothetical protein
MVLRVDEISINNLSFTITNLGAKTKSVHNRIRTLEKFRQYDNMMDFIVNYTPNMRTISDNQEDYSITFRGNSWRIAEVFEHDDRQWVSLMCYRNEPSVAV